MLQTRNPAMIGETQNKYRGRADPIREPFMDCICGFLNMLITHTQLTHSSSLALSIENSCKIIRNWLVQNKEAAKIISKLIGFGVVGILKYK